MDKQKALTRVRELQAQRTATGTQHKQLFDQLGAQVDAMQRQQAAIMEEAAAAYNETGGRIAELMELFELTTAEVNAPPEVQSPSEVAPVAADSPACEGCGTCECTKEE